MAHNDDDWPVFWCSLLGPVLFGDMTDRQRQRYFHQLSQQEHLLPGGKRKKISLRTLRRKWLSLQADGVTGLYRRHRDDRGKPRCNRDAMIARAVELKKEQPYRSDDAINRMLQAEFGRTIPRSTLYRHLRRHGATRLKLGISEQKVRCRWTRDQSNALWVGDFEHGPVVMNQHRAVKSYLSAWIDCHSRYIVEARYYFRENLDILIDSLLRAWGNHGASRELYVDNANIYHAKALKLACTELNIQLLHRPPRDPPAGGLIERFFETVQTQLEAEVKATELLTIDQLNRFFVSWLEVAYHRRVHSETEQTPHQRYHQQLQFKRHVNLSDIIEFFHHRESRKVNDDFCDVRIGNHFYAVDPELRRQQVIVHYDPFGDSDEVMLYSPDGQYLGRAKRHQRQKRHDHTPEPSVPQPIEPHYLELLQQQYEAIQAQQRQQGLDYQSAQRRNIWSLPRFAAKFAQLLGRKGGASAMTTQEIEAITRFHDTHHNLNETLLLRAFERADPKTIPTVLFHLQQLLEERNP
jgi:transposase InsO family protein